MGEIIEMGIKGTSPVPSSHIKTGGGGDKRE
jgi:hypothetical protein